MNDMLKCLGCVVMMWGGIFVMLMLFGLWYGYIVRKEKVECV